MRSVRSLVVMASVVAMLLATVPMADAAVKCGNGISMAKEPKAAGAEAARKAKAALGEAEAKLVLVHYNGRLIGQAPAVVEGVASVFDRAVIYGCGAYAALTQESNNADVAVLALGGDVQVTAAAAETRGKKDDANCGKRLGEQLKDAAAQAAAGKVLLLFGACHIPRNDRVVKGVCSVLGETFPIVGAAAFRDSVVVRGEVAKAPTNVALLLTGPFTCGFGLRKDMSPEGLLASARQAFQSAIGEDREKVCLVLVSDCGGRRGAMLKHKSFAKELAAMKEVAGEAPIFGFYGSGEMGCTAAGKAPQGVGYHISTCAIKSK